MKTKVITAWLPKGLLKNLGKRGMFDDIIGFPELYWRRGSKDEYLDADWPPVKIKVTVEVIG